jgi:hypothetical protein
MPDSTAILHRVKHQGGFITADDVKHLVKTHPKVKVLVRTGMGRFITTMDCCQHYVGIIDSSTDHLRDVSIYYGHEVPATARRAEAQPAIERVTEYTLQYMG